jgi:hypothetical protein
MKENNTMIFNICPIPKGSFENQFAPFMGKGQTN